MTTYKKVKEKTNIAFAVSVRVKLKIITMLLLHVTLRVYLHR